VAVRLERGSAEGGVDGDLEGRMQSHSPAETQALGARLAQRLQRGDVVAFTGDLGTGKTCMIQGLCAALGVTDPVNSPTFVLINQYEGQLPAGAAAADAAVTIHHFDLYRLSGAAELFDLGAEEIMGGDGLSLIEWADRGAGALPLPRWEVALAHAGDGRRDIRWQYRSAGERGAAATGQARGTSRKRQEAEPGEMPT